MCPPVRIALGSWGVWASWGEKWPPAPSQSLAVGLLELVRRKPGAPQKGRGLGVVKGEEWTESGYILKVEPIGFLIGMEVKSR